MSLVERQRQFLEAAQQHFGTSRAVRPRELFGVSNSAKIVEGGIQLGVVNLDNVRDDVEAMIFGCVLRFPPEDEVYFAVLVRNDKANFLQRLADMKRLGAAARNDGDDSSEFALEAAVMRSRQRLPGPRSNTVPGIIWCRSIWRRTGGCGYGTQSSGIVWLLI